MGFGDWFAIKSAKRREMERRQYAKWAFPYGDTQKQILEGILKELLPEENGKTAMAVFLLAKEGYQGSYEEYEEDLRERTEEQKRAAAVSKMSPLLTGKYKKCVYRYLALVMADSQIDEAMNYPSSEQLRQKAQELEGTLDLKLR